MKSALNTVRWLLSIIFGVLLCAIVFVTPLVLSMTTLISNRETLKRWVDRSGIYEEADTLVMDFLRQQAEKSIEGEISPSENPFSEHDIEKTVKEVLTPEFSRKVVEATVDGAYDYLEGKSGKIEIMMEKKEAENAFLKVLFVVSGLEFDSTDQIRDLPVCTDKQEENLDKGFENIEDACLPQELDLDSIFENTFPASADGSDSFDIAQGSISTTEIEQHFPARTVFQAIKLAPYFIISFVVLLSILVVVLVPGWKTGLIFTGIAGILSSLASLAFALLLYLGDTVSALVISASEQITKQQGELILNSSGAIAKDIFGRDALYSTIFLILFIAMTVWGILLKPKVAAKSASK
jgi:hypothetical protein